MFANLIPGRRPHQLRWAGSFALLLLLAQADTALAGWGLGNLFSGLATRSRVVQVCVVVMCIALFILMKKFVPTPAHSPARSPAPPRPGPRPGATDSEETP